MNEAISAGALSIPDVRLMERLGQGAHTVVYRVCRGDREYAMKVLRSAGDAEQARTFRREAALLAALRGPGLATVHEVGESAGIPYLIMDLIRGRSLAQLLREAPLPESRAVELTGQVAAALAIAHGAGLVHRDVKPDNVMVDDGGTAQLIDFGLAARTGAHTTDTAAGTFRYSAPEQTGMLRRPVDARSDLYALGVVLFECLTGTVPFDADDVGELLRMHVATPPPDVRTRRPGVAAALAAVVHKLLAKDPDDRYQSGQALAADLDRIAAGQREEFPLGTAKVRGTEVTRLVGRQKELDRLVRHWRAAAAGSGEVVLLTGAAGSGKSRLARELTATVHAADRPVLFGKCGPDRMVPFGPLRQALDGYLQSVTGLPEPERKAARQRLRDAAGSGSVLLGALSPVLAALVGVPEASATDDQRRFVEALAALLSGFAHANDGAVLHIDDVQWCDEGTSRVLRHLTGELADTPLLVVLTARDDPASRPGVEAMLADLGPAVKLQLPLEPLGAADIGRLVSGQLDAKELPPKLAERLAARSAGNPLAVLEYVRAIVDAGLIQPSWGRWLLDETGLEALALPEDTIELILRRIDGLGVEARRLLTAAAAIGAVFPYPLAVAVSGGTGADTAFVDATAAQLIEPLEAGRYGFLHDRIREALLGELDRNARRRLHQRIAERLDHDRGAVADGDLVAGGEEYIYAVARHYLDGETDRAPRRVYAAATAAGRAALGQHSPRDAFDFLLRAAAAATAAGVTPDAQFHADLGCAASRIGEQTVAEKHLHLALRAEPDRHRRAELYALLSEAYFLAWRNDEAIEAARLGTAEIGHPLPRNPVLLAVSTLAMFVAGLVLGRFPGLARTNSETKRRVYRIRVRLHHAAAHGASRTKRNGLLAALALRDVLAARRLGPGPESVLTDIGVAFVATAAGARRISARLAGSAVVAAGAIGNPRILAHVRFLEAVMLDEIVGMSTHTGDHLRRLLRTHRRWLDLGDYLTTVTWAAQIALMRGYVAEAEALYRQGLAEASPEEVLRNPLAGIGPVVAGMRGHATEGETRLRPLREVVATSAFDHERAVNAAVAELKLAVEQGDTGPAFDAAVDRLTALKLRPAKAFTYQRSAWADEAFGRLAQVGAVPEADTAERARRLAVARRAVTRLRRAAHCPVLRAMHQVARAGLDQYGGGQRAALRRLARMQVWAGGLDLPLLEYETARIRARAYHALGCEADGDRQAAAAFHLARVHGWPTRARWVRAEFALDSDVGVHRSAGAPLPLPGDPAGVGTNTTGRGAPSETGQRRRAAFSDPQTRRLQALHQVSLAAATILDPAELSRVALDELLRIFAADRAYLFLAHDGDGDDRLVPYLGRDQDGHDIEQLTDYGSSLVDRVHASGEALVVTGNADGCALGSRSVVVHGLRSIMVAPLQVKGRLLGVVYLDSRAAGGVFTADDVEILAAITNHVALSLETARTAQLERAVHAAHRERELADTLRHAMAALTAVLDPGDVTAQLTRSVASILRLPRTGLVRRLADGSVVLTAVHPPVTAAAGADAAAGVDAAADAGDSVGGDPVLDVAGDPVMAQLLAAVEPEFNSTAVRPAPVPEVFGGTVGWLAVPLVTRGEQRGLLLAATDRACTDAEVKVAAALAGQGMVALDNALLFQQATRMAERDALTGLLNRRRFSDLAADVLRRGRPTAAVMVDIDHFKKINDVYGHSVGDQVIRAVGERLSAVLRTDDVICRYGGEEFAVLLDDTLSDLARTVAERARAAVAGTPVPTDAGSLQVTVSVGVAADGVPGTLADLVNRADAALYDAKRGGRNRVAGPAD